MEERQKPRAATGYETNTHRIHQRLRQLWFGYKSEVYATYLAHVPKDSRIEGEHPVTPRVERNWYKKGFDLEVKDWKRALWQWAKKEGVTVADEDGSSSSSNLSEDTLGSVDEDGLYIPDQSITSKMQQQQHSVVLCIECKLPASQKCSVCHYPVCGEACFDLHFKDDL